MFETETPERSDPAGVSTPNRHKAMDWSLVLLSQGIESTIAQDEQTGGWQLLVPREHARAVRETLHLYEQENRAWPFRQPLPWVGFAFDWTVLAWVGIMGIAFLLQTHPGSWLETVGICNAGLVRSGEGWRPLTATMLHADLGHLAMNAVFGLLLMGIAMGRFGSGLTLLTTTVAGALANLLPLLWREDRSSALGASGIVMAALGMIAASAIMHYWQHKHPPRLVMEAVAGGLMLFVLVGVSPTSDVAAHAGGFLFGLLLGLPLARVPITLIRRPRLNLCAGFVYCLLLTAAWGWGLKAHGP